MAKDSEQDEDQPRSKAEQVEAEQAEQDSGNPVPAGVQVSPPADRPRRTQDVEGNLVDEPLD